MLRSRAADARRCRLVDDADDPALPSLTHGQWIAEKDSQWSLARVQTAVDVVVRSGAGFVVADATQGAALWIVGGGEMTLLCATGTCQPTGGSWAASLVRAARVAAGAQRVTRSPAGSAAGGRPQARSARFHPAPPHRSAREVRRPSWRHCSCSRSGRRCSRSCSRHDANADDRTAGLQRRALPRGRG